MIDWRSLFIPRSRTDPEIECCLRATALPIHETMNRAPTRSTGFPFRLPALVALVLILVVGPFLLFGSRIEEWTRLALEQGRNAGVTAQILCVLLLASDVLLPVPSSVVSAACGAWWGLWLGSALSALGMILGSCLGYGLGRWAGTGRLGMGPGEEAKLHRLYARYGEWITVILRPVPVLAEASAIFAGLSRMSWTRFLGLSILANVVVSLFYAGAGVLIGGHSEAAGFIALILVLALAAGVLKATLFRPGDRSRRTTTGDST